MVKSQEDEGAASPDHFEKDFFAKLGFHRKENAKNSDYINDTCDYAIIMPTGYDINSQSTDRTFELITLSGTPYQLPTKPSMPAPNFQRISFGPYQI